MDNDIKKLGELSLDQIVRWIGQELAKRDKKIKELEDWTYSSYRYLNKALFSLEEDLENK